jgi:hypothetical protein
MASESSRMVRGAGASGSARHWKSLLPFWSRGSHQ